MLPPLPNPCELVCVSDFEGLNPSDNLGERAEVALQVRNEELLIPLGGLQLSGRVGKLLDAAIKDEELILHTHKFGC